MNLEFFPHFVRMNHKGIDFNNEELMEVGVQFYEYLKTQFSDKPERLAEMCKIEPKDIIPNLGHPFKVNGYDPVLVLKFGDFCKAAQQESEKS